MKKNSFVKVLWFVSFSLYALDANAWGLYTHLYFSQQLLLCAPALFDPRIYRAIQKFPQLVMAGACLPDLAVISKSFSHSHQWQISEDMLNRAESEQEIAIAVGYASHLFVDVIAHNHFVPAHEAKWLNRTIITHISSEWAMDAYVSPHLQYSPRQLISNHLEMLSQFTAKTFGVSANVVNMHLKRLSRLDGLLRASGIAPMLLHAIKLRDKEFVKNLNYYLNKTEHALGHFHVTLNGQRPSWEPELGNLTAAELNAWRAQCLGDMRIRVSTPIDHFYGSSQTSDLL